MTVPLAWEYDDRIVERRYTGPALQRLFADGAEWSSVDVGPVGGYVVAWATLSGRILRGFGEFGPGWTRWIGRLLLPVSSWLLNGVGALLSRAESRWHSGPFDLPMGLMMVARRPAR